MTPPLGSCGWRVVVGTFPFAGSVQVQMFGEVPGGTREEAIDFVLEKYLRIRGRELSFANGWRLVSAWGVPEYLVGEAIEIEPPTDMLEVEARRRAS